MSRRPKMSVYSTEDVASNVTSEISTESRSRSNTPMSMTTTSSYDDIETILDDEVNNPEGNANPAQSVSAGSGSVEFPKSSFMSLPPEVRQEVYKQYVENALKGVFPYPQSLLESAPANGVRLGLLRANKIIHNELIPEVYRELRFKSFTAAATALQEMGIYNVGEIRKLVIDTDSIIDELSAEFVFSTVSCSQRRGGKLSELCIDIGTALAHLDNNTAFCQGRQAMAILFHPRSRIFRHLVSIRGLYDFWILYEPWQGPYWCEIWARSNWVSDRYIADMQRGFNQVMSLLDRPVARPLPPRKAARSASV